MHVVNRTINTVKGFSLAIEEEEIVGLLELNGAGKSTLIKMMTGIFTPTSGTIKLIRRYLINEKISF